MNKRREIELAVIDAAVAFDSDMTRKNFKRTKVEDALHEAVLRYTFYGLAEPRFTRTVHSAPDTSWEAGEWMKQFALTDAAAVFRWIHYAWRGRQTLPPLGLTTDEVEQYMDRSHQTISARVNQLKETGWVIDSGERRKTRSGRRAIVWTPTKTALDLVDRVGLPIPISTTRKENHATSDHA